MLIDTHCHLSFKAFNDSWPDVIKRAREKDVQMIAVGAARATSEKAIAIAEKSDGIFAAVGLHPTHVEDEPFDYDWFSSAADNPKVVAIGETGIDYYHLDDGSESPLSFLRKQGLPRTGCGESSFNASGLDPRFRRDDKLGSVDGKEKRAVVLQKQEDLLRQHLTLARDKNLPVILHCRDAPTPSRIKARPELVSGYGTGSTPPRLHPKNSSPASKPAPNWFRGAGSSVFGDPGAGGDITGAAHEHLYRIIKDFGYFRCVLHCFGGDWNIAQKFLDLGCMISFTGIVTYKNASPKSSPHPLPRRERELEEVVRNVPLDKFMLETDSPYLAPEPERGKQNEPAYVEYIARAIAEIRAVSYDDIAQATTENARRFFKI